MRRWVSLWIVVLVLASALPLRAAAQDELNNRPSGASLIAVPGAASNVIYPRGTHRWYRFAVDTAGELRTTIANPAPGGKMEMVFQIYNANLDVIQGWVAPPGPGADTENVFAVPAPGDYYLELAESDDDLASARQYTLKLDFIAAVDDGEPHDRFDQATPLFPGSVAQWAILPQGDHDWYRIDSPGRAEVQVSLTAPEEKMQMAAQVWNANKDVILGWQTAPAPGATLDFLFDTRQPGAYYLEAVESNDDQWSPRPYAVEVTVTATVDVDADNLAFDRARELKWGDAVQGTILPRGTHNWYRIDTPGRAEVRVGLSAPADLELAAQVWNANKDVILGWQTASEPGADLSFLFDTRQSGAYYLEVAESQDDRRSPLPYTLNVTVTPTVDVDADNLSFATAWGLKPGAAVQGTILPRDTHNWYCFDSPGRARVHVRIDGAPEDLEPAAQAWNANKDVILGWQTPPEPGAPTDFVFDTRAGGTYYLEVAESNDDRRSPLPYTLHLTVTPAADVESDNHSFATARGIGLSEVITGSILPRGDHDWYRVQVLGPGELKVALSENPPELTVVAQVWNADRRVVAGWQGAAEVGADGLARAQVLEAGAYYVEVASAGDNAASTDAYHMSVSFTAE